MAGHQFDEREGRGGESSASSNPLFYISHSGKIVREICVPCMSETYAHTSRAGRWARVRASHALPSIISTKLQEILLYAHVYIFTYVNWNYIKYLHGYWISIYPILSCKSLLIRISKDLHDRIGLSVTLRIIYSRARFITSYLFLLISASYLSSIKTSSGNHFTRIYKIITFAENTFKLILYS